MAIKESPSASIAAEESQIAKAVLMPGDPCGPSTWRTTIWRSGVASTRPEHAGLHRHLQGQAHLRHGPRYGRASMGIYSYELYQFFGVDTIIRIAPPAHRG